MTVQEMALRNEVRQMMCEAGFNRETIKTEAKKLIKDVAAKPVKQACSETDIKDIISQYIKSNVKSIIKEIVADEVFAGLRYRMVKDAAVNININGKWLGDKDDK